MNVVFMGYSGYNLKINDASKCCLRIVVNVLWHWIYNFILIVLISEVFNLWFKETTVRLVVSFWISYKDLGVLKLKRWVESEIDIIL